MRHEWLIVSKPGNGCEVIREQNVPNVNRIPGRRADVILLSGLCCACSCMLHNTVDQYPWRVEWSAWQLCLMMTTMSL